LILRPTSQASIFFSTTPRAAASAVLPQVCIRGKLQGLRIHAFPPVLAVWKGQESNVAAAQKTLLKRCQLNGLARDGKYARAMGRPGKYPTVRAGCRYF